ncbi:unnamed protein product [Cuscuta epithymum]|uniref:RNase H type-1 domain-containing protein n=1 Tax=Cuscuta epithymum TaxID=186058 RepID=A0AAV0EJI1_9ASTE|nr:unnamed protein product [Cuscuta epithymum]
MMWYGKELVLMVPMWFLVVQQHCRARGLPKFKKKQHVNMVESHTSWKKPATGVIKVNVDGALNIDRGKRALAWIARDDMGNFIRGGMNTVSADWTTHITEAIGVREVLSWAKEQGWSQVEVEIDALLIISRL